MITIDRPLQEILERTAMIIDDRFAEFRGLELAAAINRMRTLKIMQ